MPLSDDRKNRLRFMPWISSFNTKNVKFQFLTVDEHRGVRGFSSSQVHALDFKVQRRQRAEKHQAINR